MKQIFEILFLGGVIVIADVQAQLIEKNKPINHFAWGALFAGIIAGAWYLEERSWWFLAVLVLEHFVFFSPALNFLRRPRKPFFYISSTPGSGSLWDKVLIPVEKYYPFIWAVGLAGFIALQFFL